MRLKDWRTVFVGMAILVGVGALLVWAFRAGHEGEQTGQEPSAQPASRVSTQNGETVTHLDRTAQSKIGLAVASPVPVSRQKELRAYGTVLQLQDLVDLRNSYVTAVAQADKMRAALEVSRKEYERLKALHDTNANVSDKAFQAAEGAWRSDEANVSAAEVAVHVLESTARQRWGPVLTSWLRDGSPAFERLIQRQDVLIQLTLPAETRSVSMPQTARIQDASGTLATAGLVSPSPATDPRIQGASLFYRVPAQMTGFLPGMNILAYLPTGPQVQGVVIPASAVVWWQGKAWGYVQVDAEHFARREVSTETPLQDGWFVERGLSAGDRLVVQGAQLLLSEEFRTQIEEE